MIISHENRYLFVELPLTGSTAISKELVANYGGQSIISKHATYRDFLKVASDEEKRYFVFSGMRNPMGHTISAYEKYRHDHKNRFTDKNKLARRKGLYRGLVKRSDLLRYRFIQEHGDNFAAYFRRFYRMPYDNWSRLDHTRLDYLIRFESMQEDFAAVLGLLDLEQIRPLPIVNPTQKKSQDLNDYFTADTRARAVRIFGPYMEKWGYEFPSDWEDTQVSNLQRMTFNIIGLFRSFVWLYLRPSKPLAQTQNRENA